MKILNKNRINYLSKITSAFLVLCAVLIFFTPIVHAVTWGDMQDILYGTSWYDEHDTCETTTDTGGSEAVGEGSDDGKVYKSGLSGPYILEQFMIHLLKRLSQKYPGKTEADFVTKEHVIALVAFAIGEGGDINNPSIFNPLNLSLKADDLPTQPWANGGSGGQQAYASFDVGVEANARAMSHGYQSRLGDILGKKDSTAKQFMHTLTYFKEYEGNLFWAEASVTDPNYYSDRLWLVNWVRNHYETTAAVVIGTPKHEYDDPKITNKNLITYKELLNSKGGGSDDDSGGGTSSGGVSTSTGCGCDPAATDNGVYKPKILIGPGHTGKEDFKMSGYPAVIDYIYGGNPELQDVWEVAQIVKKELTSKGYEVLMTKNNVKDSPFSWDRAQQANDNNVDLAFEIHTDSSTWRFGDGEVWSQFEGGYRKADENGNGQNVKLVASAEVIKKSQEYAKKFAEARQKAGEEGVKSFSGTGAFGTRKADPKKTPAGNIPLVMLWSEVPWIYLEAGAAKNGTGLTDKQIKIYADGIIEGVVASLPISQSTSDCVDSTAVNGVVKGDILQTALNLAWPNHRELPAEASGKGQPDSAAKPYAKPDFIKAFDKYNKCHGSAAYTDCGKFVGTVIRATGVDPDWPPCGGGDAHALGEKDVWELIQPAGTKVPLSKLKPGDVMTRSSHNMIYVGEQKGSPKGYVIRQASWGSQTPNAQVMWEQSTYNIFRLKK